MNHTRYAARSKQFGLASAFALTLLISGCDAGANSSAQADPAAIAAASESVQASYKEPIFNVDGAAFDAKQAAGKKVAMVSVDMSIVLEQVSADAMAEALRLVGATFTVYDGKSSVTQQVQGVQAAIAEGADVIVLNSIDPEQISGAVSAAKTARIPVIAMLQGDPSTSLPEGVVSQATYPYSDAGDLLADWISNDLGGDGTGVGIELITSDEVPQTSDYVRGFEESIKEGCPACNVYRENVPLADWQTKLLGQVNSTLNSRPDVKYVVPIYDGMATFVEPGIKSSGRTDVKLVTFNATKSVMQMMDEGDIIAANLGSPQAWLGWAAADQALRVLANVAPASDENIGLRMFDKTNVQDLDLDAPESTWYGTDFVSGYKSLWQIA